MRVEEESRPRRETVLRDLGLDSASSSLESTPYLILNSIMFPWQTAKNTMRLDVR
jgi:hypothetical protein